MNDLVKDKPITAMSHEGVKFLLEEMVRKFVADGYRVPQPALVKVSCPSCLESCFIRDSYTLVQA